VRAHELSWDRAAKDFLSLLNTYENRN